MGSRGQECDSRPAGPGIEPRAERRSLQKAVRILSGEVYRGFGPTLASEYLAKKHKLAIGQETLRQLMKQARLRRNRKQQIEATHEWRQRRGSRGEMVQWDTSEHDWLEGRGERLYLIHMIDDATSQLLGRFVHSDSTEENMRLLQTYLDRHGRPLNFYTDEASLFRTAPKVWRDQKELARDEREPLPPTQIGRALQELHIVWIAVHSPHAKGRVERSFGTAQDRLVKGLRVAGARTLDRANHYLETEFLPRGGTSIWWWHRPTPSMRIGHWGRSTTWRLRSRRMETRQVNNDYTLQFHGRLYRIESSSIMAGLRGVRYVSRNG